MKRLKAYEVREPDEGHCVIEFAASNAAARREGAAALDTEWEGVESCRRRPEFDAYAPGPVPPLVLIDHGWWFECHHCGVKVDADGEAMAGLEAIGLPPDLESAARRLTEKARAAIATTQPPKG